jgi:hypothetical protein
MSLALPIVRSDRHRLHEPGGEARIRLRTPGTEVAASAEATRAAPRDRFARILEAQTQPDDDTLAVDDAALGRYELTTIGAPMCATLAGLEDGLRRAGD